MHIRRALAEECRTLTELAMKSKAFWGYDENFMRQCAGELTVRPEELPMAPAFLLQEKDEIVGFYQIEPINKQQAEVDMLFVKPRFLGKGYGKALLQHARIWAKSAGYASIIVQSDPNAAGFYAKEGGVFIKRRPSGSLPGRFLPVYLINL